MHVITFCNVEREPQHAFKGSEAQPFDVAPENQFFWISASRGPRINNTWRGNVKSDPTCVIVVDKGLRVHVWPQTPPLLEFETATHELQRRMSTIPAMLEYRSKY